MSFRFICPNTGHKIETAFEVDDDELMLLGADNIRTQCSFCGGAHEWVLVPSKPGEGLRSRRKSLAFLSRGGAD